jgi:hypothetical protein
VSALSGVLDSARSPDDRLVAEVSRLRRVFEQLPKETSPNCTSAREFRVILLCPTVLFGAQVACYAVPSSRFVVKRCAYNQVPTTKRGEPDPLGLHS